MKQISVGPRDFASVDDEDYSRVLEAGPWSLIEWRGKQYAKKHVRESDEKYPFYNTVSMHHFITNFDYTDHIDGNGLNNQKSNLRNVTHKQNLQAQKVQSRSKSGYRGVTYFPNAGEWTRKKPWRARIKIDGYDTTLGYFATKEEAAIAWNKEALKAWGDFAFQNIIPTE